MLARVGIFREGNGTPLQYSCLENPMDGGTWWAAVHGVTQSQTRLSDFTFFLSSWSKFTNITQSGVWGIYWKVLRLKVQAIILYNTTHLNPEKAMAPRSSTLAWKIPWMEEPGRLKSMGSQRVGHDWATSLSLFTFMHWRRKWQPTPALLPGESQGRGSLVGCPLWGRTESDTTEAT